MSKIKIKDGNLPTIAKMRELFELAVNGTAVIKKHYPLAIREGIGCFEGYADGQTNSLWVGFALGMRCTQRIINATSWLPSDGAPLELDRVTIAKLGDNMADRSAFGDRDIRCGGCGKTFDLAHSEMATGTLPHTLTDLPDYNTPHAVCPHCGYAT